MARNPHASYEASDHQRIPIIPIVNNVTTTSAGFALDARQGKALDDKITTINNSLITKYPIKSQYNKVSVANTWQKLFTVTYGAYNYLYLVFIFKNGWNSSGMAFVRIRFTPTGIKDTDSILKVIDMASYQYQANTIIIHQESTTSVSFWGFCATSTTTDVGYEILSVHSEAGVLNNFNNTSYWTFYDTFPNQTEKPSEWITKSEMVSSTWTLINAYNTTVVGSSGTVNTTVSYNYSEVIVEYGQVNSGQSYGGATISSPWQNGVSKPCFVPFYNGATLSSMLYIFFNGGGQTVTTNVNTNNVGSSPNVRFKIWAR